MLDAGAGRGSTSTTSRSSGIAGWTWAWAISGGLFRALDALGDLSMMPFRDDVFEAALNIVTLEHVREPARVIEEMARVLGSGGRLLLVAPHEWEEHQQPHDYFRYTRYGLRYLLERAGFEDIRIEPVGGFFHCCRAGS